MRINVAQLKVGMTMYYFNNIYIYRGGGGKKSKRSVERMKERDRENERKNFSFFLSGCLLQEMRNPFIGFPNDFH